MDLPFFYFLFFIFYNVIHNYELNLIHDQYLFINWLFRLSSVRIVCCQLQCILRYVKFEIECFNFKNEQIINNIYMQISCFFGSSSYTKGCLQWLTWFLCVLQLELRVENLTKMAMSATARRSKVKVFALTSLSCFFSFFFFLFWLFVWWLEEVYILRRVEWCWWQDMSSEVVDSNPYSRLMALQRMGIVENYERIREFSVAIVVCIYLLFLLSSFFSSIHDTYCCIWFLFFFLVSHSMVMLSFIMCCLLNSDVLSIGNLHEIIGGWWCWECCSWNAHKVWHRSSFVVWLWQSGVSQYE